MTDDSAPDRCTISMDNVHLCGDPVMPNALVPVCLAHAAMLLTFMREQFDDAVTNAPFGPRYVAAMTESIGRGRRAAAQINERNAVVYYVKVGEMVKIGTTTNLKNRMRGYPPGSKLLASEPGGLQVERERHEQFADCLAAGNEWFVPTDRLLAHIETVRSRSAA